MSVITIRDYGGVKLAVNVQEVSSIKGTKMVEVIKECLKDNNKPLTRSKMQLFLDQKEFETLVNGLKECL